MSRSCQCVQLRTDFPRFHTAVLTVGNVPQFMSSKISPDLIHIVQACLDGRSTVTLVISSLVARARLDLQRYTLHQVSEDDAAC